MRILGILLAQALVLSAAQADVKGNWKRHVVWEGLHNNVAVAADFTGDGKVDIISNAGNKTRLFVAPDWKEVIIGDHMDHNFIHGETFDVDGDGDADFIGARYQPGLIVWFEQPNKNAAAGPWKARIAEDEIIGIHGVLKADVNGDGKLDLLANSAQPKGKFPDSAVWLEVPKNPRLAKRWTRHVFAKNDAPGLSHYLGAGDLNGDGRLDITLAAKGGPSDKSGKGEWFAWWEAGKDPTRPFRKHLLPGKHPGATNILPADVNGDGVINGADLAIVLGFFERSANGRVFRDRNKTRDSVSADRLATFRCRQLYNSALAVDEDGRLAALYRKTHLFGSAEKAAFSPGERLGPIFELVGGVRCALLICYDIEFPEAGN